MIDFTDHAWQTDGIYMFIQWTNAPGPVFSYKLRYIIGWLVEMPISTNHKPIIYRNLCDNSGPGVARS